MQKVASAWSRQNLPPPELDKMFRNIESIYKANRALLGVCEPRFGIGLDPSHVNFMSTEIERNRHQPIVAESARRSLDAMGKQHSCNT